jgi:hypothetical protein
MEPRNGVNSYSHWICFTDPYSPQNFITERCRDISLLDYLASKHRPIALHYAGVPVLRVEKFFLHLRSPARPLRRSCLWAMRSACLCAAGEGNRAIQNFGTMVKSPSGYPIQSPRVTVAYRQAETFSSTMKFVRAQSRVLFLTIFSACPAYAQSNLPWCGIPDNDGNLNCVYTSEQQCLVSLRGIGGQCVQNPSPLTPALAPTLSPPNADSGLPLGLDPGPPPGLDGSPSPGPPP